LEVAFPYATVKRFRFPLQDRLEREAKAFHRRVREGYLQLAAMHPKRFLVLDGNRDLADVLAAFERELRLRLPGCPAL